MSSLLWPDRTAAASLCCCLVVASYVREPPVEIVSPTNLPKFWRSPSILLIRLALLLTIVQKTTTEGNSCRTRTPFNERDSNYLTIGADGHGSVWPHFILLLCFLSGMSREARSIFSRYRDSGRQCALLYSKYKSLQGVGSSSHSLEMNEGER